jgi:hypothetical protein
MTDMRCDRHIVVSAQAGIRFRYLLAGEAVSNRATCAGLTGARA